MCPNHKTSPNNVLTITYQLLVKSHSTIESGYLSFLITQLIL